VGTVEKYKTKALAQKAVEALLLKLNSETPQQRMAVVMFGAICDRYIQEEIPERYSTSKSYQSNIKLHLKPRWGSYLLDRIRPRAVEDWLKKLPAAPKSKTDILSVTRSATRSVRGWAKTGAPMKVQQERMRHASIQTTMNVYGQGHVIIEERGEREGCRDWCSSRLRRAPERRFSYWEFMGVCR
jgi:hypothetical protein